MSWWEALVLGVVQGLTEFFPVSSSGHLVMTERLLGLTLPGVAFDVALHVATLVSVLIVYHKRIQQLLMGCIGRGERNEWPYVFKLVVASIPAAIVGVAFQDWFEARFDDPIFTGTMLLVTGSFVWSSRWTGDTRRFSALELMPVIIALVVALWAGTIVPFLAVLAVEATIMAVSRLTAPPEWQPEPTWTGATAMGIAQAVAILPGISRSGSTVITGLWRRIDPVAAAEFSFLMSVPAIIGAAVLSLPDLTAEGGGPGGGLGTILIGAIAAGIAGVLAIRFFVDMLRRRSFHAFAYYCWLVGALFILYIRAS